MPNKEPVLGRGAVNPAAATAAAQLAGGHVQRFRVQGVGRRSWALKASIIGFGSRLCKGFPIYYRGSVGK